MLWEFQRASETPVGRYSQTELILMVLIFIVVGTRMVGMVQLFWSKFWGPLWSTEEWELLNYD